jgi:hypothetical protein
MFINTASQKIKPLLEGDNNMGCVTVTYNPVRKKYLMCVTDGGDTASRMNTYLLEADRLDGDWKIIAYLKGVRNADLLREHPLEIHRQ